MKAAESLAKEYIYYYYNDISIVLCVQGCQNLKLFTKYMIELNVHLLVADGIERLFVWGILSKHSSCSCSQSAANL